MTIRAVINQKGGVGKTTTVVTLAGLMLERGRRQLVVDLDPHASLTSYLGVDPETVKGGCYAFFHRTAEKRELAPEREVRVPGETGLELLPGSPALATVERRFGNCAGMGRVMSRALSGLASDYDDIWIDCSPTLGVLMINALAACEDLIIPVQTEYLALKGLERMFASLTLVERSRGLSIPRLVLPTMYDRRTRASNYALEELRSRYREYLWDDPVPVDTRFRHASQRGRPLSQLHPQARGVEVYRRLLDSLLACEKHTVLAS